jgi:hypothetical protein
MKPRHAARKRLSRCKCCQSVASKKNARGRKYGNAIGRAADKAETRQQMKESTR